MVVRMMSRRDFLRQFILVLLAIVIPAKWLAALDEDELEALVEYGSRRVEFRLMAYWPVGMLPPMDTAVITW